MNKTFYFEITGENHKDCGYEFFVEAENIAEAMDIVEYDVGVDIKDVSYYGEISFEEAEMYGLDTY